MREVASNLHTAVSGHTEASDTEDKLGTTMKFIRATEQGALGEISLCLTRYPTLGTMVANPYEINGNLSISLRKVKDHAIELAREAALSEFCLPQGVDGEEDMQRAARRRKKGNRLLYKLAPGRSGNIGAIKDGRGNFQTDSPAMVQELRAHWSDTFRARGVNQERLQAWLREDAEVRALVGPSHDPLRRLHLKRKDIRKALKLSNNSAPGPDGIPYGAWRSLGDLAIDTLHDAFHALFRSDGQELLRRDYPGFNESLLFFLPKKPIARTDEGADVFEVGGVRPLNVTNADNRLMASSVRLVLEPILGPLITHDQRGFIAGRSMIANLLDVDEAMILKAAQGEEGMVFFMTSQQLSPPLNTR